MKDNIAKQMAQGAIDIKESLGQELNKGETAITKKMKDEKKIFMRHAIKQSEKDFMDADIDLSKGGSVSIKRSADADT